MAKGANINNKGLCNITMSIKKEFAELVSLDNKKSFFLFAGAGTGKTYTLVELLKIIRENYSEYFRLTSKQFYLVSYKAISEGHKKYVHHFQESETC